MSSENSTTSPPPQTPPATQAPPQTPPATQTPPETPRTAAKVVYVAVAFRRKSGRIDAAFAAPGWPIAPMKDDPLAYALFGEFESALPFEDAAKAVGAALTDDPATAWLAPFWKDPGE